MAQWRGQQWRQELEAEGSMARGSDRDDMPSDGWDPRPTLRASTEAQDAVWLRVADMTEVSVNVGWCEEAGLRSAFTARMSPSCKPAIDALQTLDAAYAEGLLKRYCKLVSSSEKICDGVKSK